MAVALSSTAYYLQQSLASLTIEKEWQIARARHQLKHLATELGFSRVYSAQLVTSLSELGYNLVFHSDQGGIVHVAKVTKTDAVGIKLLCIDKGPGIPSIADALTDGFSTNGGLGGGLPGVERLMDEFYIESNHLGTRIECIKWSV
jgi:serine/threonine-protein kinase RsbT